VSVVGCGVGQSGFPVCGSTLARTGVPVFGSDAVPIASARQRSADIAGRLSQGLEEVGWGVGLGTAEGWAAPPVGVGGWTG